MSRRRRLWPVLIVIAAVVGVLLFARHRPVEVQADYVLTSRTGLVALHVRWEGVDDGKVISASYHYDADTPAPRIQSQTLELPPNRYRVRLTVERDDGTSEVIEQEIEVRQASSIELRAGGGQ